MNDSIREQFLSRYEQCALITEKVNVVTDPQLANLIGADPHLILDICSQIVAEVEDKHFVFFDQNLEGNLYYTIGRCHNILSNLEEALRAYTTAMYCFQTTNNPEMEAQSMSGIGGVYDKSGDYATAYDYTYNALEKALKTGNRLLEARLMNDLGYMHVIFGEHEKAMNYLVPAIQYLEQVQDLMLLSFACDSIAQAHLGLGHVDEALQNELRAIELSRRAGNWYGVASFLNYIALIYNARGEMDTALKSLNDAQKLAEQHGFELETCNAHRFRGQIYTSLRQHVNAIESLKKAAEIADRVHANRTLYEIYEEISKVCREISDYRQALEYFERFHQRKEAAQREKESQERRYRQVIDQAKVARREADLLQLKNDQLEIEINERKLLQQKLEVLARTDSLTGLLNRRAFFTQAAVIYERASRSQLPFSLVLIDIDHFKQINDEFGHQIGDQILSKIGQRLLRMAREDDLVCRYGGEEFVILLANMGTSRAYAFAKEMKDQITRPLTSAERTYNISASIGISTFNPFNPVNFDKLIERADTAMYSAKEQGRNRITLSDERANTGTLHLGNTAPPPPTLFGDRKK